MCGRYSALTEKDMVGMMEIIEELNKRFKDTPVATGEVFPTNLAAVLTAEDYRLAPRPVKWGFPKWQGSGVIINARAETASEKPMFRKSLMERRCVVPSTGFYEWEHMPDQKKKAKYHITLPDSKMLYMAGMMNTFRNADGSAYDAFVILTTAAMGAVADIHNHAANINQAPN